LMFALPNGRTAYSVTLARSCAMLGFWGSHLFKSFRACPWCTVPR